MASPHPPLAGKQSPPYQYIRGAAGETAANDQLHADNNAQPVSHGGGERRGRIATDRATPEEGDDQSV
jgi:hypothetical protein